MDMKAMHELKEMLCKELDKIAMKGELTAGGLETVHKLTDTIKNIDKIMMLEDDEEYSERRHRDSMGRYARDDGMMRHEPYDEYGSSYKRHLVRGHYSRADAKDHMMHELGELMEGADGEQRRILERAMQEIRKA
jgi:hypothetical protein